MLTRQRVKRSFHALQRRWGRLRLRRGGRGDGNIGVFVLHALAAADSEMAVSPQRLREQLLALRAAGYQCLSLPALLGAAAGAARPSGPAFALTFDDGYASVYEHGLPLLDELDLSATLFLTVDFLDGRIAPPWRSADAALVAEYDRHRAHFRPLDWRQARALAASPRIRLGSHSMSHPLVGRLDRAAMERELRGSRQALEDRLGVAVDVFSYPFGVRRYGAYSALSEAMVGESGYVASFTSEVGRVHPGRGPWRLPRLPLTNEDAGLDAWAKAAGAYDWVAVAQRTFQRIVPNPHGG